MAANLSLKLAAAQNCCFASPSPVSPYNSLCNSFEGYWRLEYLLRFAKCLAPSDFLSQRGADLSNL